MSTATSATAPAIPETLVLSDPKPVAALSAQFPNLQFGDYELIHEIARGGMGVVYKANQKGLNRIVALKMILSGQLAGTEEVQRFQIEARAAAQLSHPHIVAIYEVGDIDGQYFFSMEFVAGKSLAQLAAQGRLAGQDAARYLERVARALHFAHQKGILHRDLKPANILLDEHDEPKITDFGLAKLKGGGATKDGHGELTRTGAIMGTPSYMAPEQAEGSTKLIGPACDVYGLGAVLYELVTGRPPFKADTALETVLDVLNRDPLAPRLLNQQVDVDLEAICMKCLEKDPQLRYATADELADDLQRYMNGEEVRASTSNLIGRLSRTLAQSKHDKELTTWGFGLMLFAVVIGVAHLATSIMRFNDIPEAWCYWVPRLVQFVLLGMILWRYRTNAFWPDTAAERLIWAVWIGYLIAFACMSWVFHELGLPHVAAYSAAALLSGLSFFVMGAHVWGWCYVIGLGFMAAAPLMAMYSRSDWSPLWFGMLWMAALGTIGVRYWRLGKSQAT